MTTSPSPYVYGYQLDDVKAVSYLVGKYPQWARSYNIRTNNPKAMNAIAKELSDNCGLTLHELMVWVGGGHMSYGIVFFDDSMNPENRTPEDAEKLEILERLLESMDILETPKAEFKMLYSAMFEEDLDGPEVDHNEPEEMANKPPPPSAQRYDGNELLRLTEELRKKYPHRKRKDKRRSREDLDGEQGTSKKPRRMKIPKYQMIVLNPTSGPKGVKPGSRV